MATKWIRIKWLKGNARGYTDLLATNLFLREVSNERITHEVNCRSEGQVFANANLSVEGSFVELDYCSEAVAQDNRKAGIISGVLRMSFKDSERILVDSVSWRNCEAIEFDLLKDNIDYKLEYGEQVSDVGEPRFSKVASKRFIDAAKFRKIVLSSYGYRCAITGSDVTEVLEAAHINPLSERGLTTAANGICLRCDLHKLFDDNLLCIRPSDMTVQISDSIAQDENYRSLVGRKVPRCKVDLHAIEERWDAFVKLQKAIKRAKS